MMNLLHGRDYDSDGTMSKTRAAALFNVSKSDVETLMPVGRERGQYGPYDTYSVSQLKNLEARVAAQKRYFMNILFWHAVSMAA